jgi:hypothetical protein
MAPKILLLAVLATIITLATAEPIPRLFNNSINPIDQGTSHVKRAIPLDNACLHGDIWLGRFCNGDIGLWAWTDMCQRPRRDAPVYKQERMCHDKAECFEYNDHDGDSQIGCTPTISAATSDVVIDSAPRAQIGMRKFESKGNKENSATERQIIISIQVQEDIPDASVSAHILC